MPIDPTDASQSVDNSAVNNTPPSTTNPATADTPASSTTPTPATTPDQQQPSSATPAPAASTTTQAQQQQPTQAQQPSISQYSHVSSDGNFGWNPQTQQWTPIGGVSNATPAPAPPAVRHASVLRQVAETLAGGPRYATTIDPQTGAATRTALPMSKSSIGMAIALTALTGGLAGLSETGPGAVGKAGAVGVQQGVNIAQQRQQAQQQTDQAAQQDYANQVSSLTRKAAAFEQSSRTVLNTAQAERYGVDSLKDTVDTNASLLSSYKDAGAVMEGDIAQDALSAGIQSGKYDPTREIAVPDGFTNINGKYEQTFSIIQNPSAKVPLTNEQAKAFADAGIPGWTQFKNATIPSDYMIPGTMLANANAQLTATKLMKQDVSQVSSALAKSTDKGDQELAKSIPNFDAQLNDKDNGPVLRAALMKAQKWVSHSHISHGMDFAESLQAMAAPTKPDPRNPKQMIPNPDAQAAQTIAGAFGGGDPAKGWKVLSAYHDAVTPEPIKNADQAQSIATDPASSPREVRRAQAYLAADKQQKSQAAYSEAGARAHADGTDVEAMYRFGKNPVTGETLSLDNAPPSALVNASGDVIPQDLVSTYKPSAQEKQTADTARQVLAISSGLQAALQENPALAGPLSGRSKSAIAKLGYGDKASQKFLDDLSFLQTAATKMHTSRFSSQILDKMGNLIQPGMNPDQFGGALSSINDIASRYANEDRLTTVADYQRQSQQQPQQQQTTQPNGSGNRTANPSAPVQAPRVVPAGATPGRDATGNIIGYRTASGQVVKF
ncbi:MAG: hypothetical protein HIU91_10060 [Acidobacteria bacterium]|nr:hypothetical protein [Acidobacteriota bacterium]